MKNNPPPFDLVAAIDLQAYLVKNKIQDYKYLYPYQLKSKRDIYGALGSTENGYLFQQHYFKWNYQEKRGGELYKHSYVNLEDYRELTNDEYLEIWKFYFKKL